MRELKSLLGIIDLSNRAKRRKAAGLSAMLLERIQAAEEAYMGRIPDNLHGSEAYENAECSIGLLDDAIDMVASVYE